VVAASLSDLAAQSDVIALTLPTGVVVRAAVSAALPADLLLADAKPGSLIVDMGSSAPSETRELADVTARADVHLVDAPVSGGTAAAWEGTLSIIAGGEPCCSNPAPSSSTPLVAA
jgi:3-hydroxyisobutyrate dehydrogenase